jgi:hypothetical protein
MVAFFVLFLVAVTWPGYLPFNRITPSVLGLPLSFAWPAIWVVLGFLVLVLLDRSESRRSGPEDQS